MSPRHPDQAGATDHPGPPEAADRRAFRAWVRAHHPDAGGDPGVFAAGMRRWQADRSAPGQRQAGEVTGFRTRGGLWLVARWWTRARRRGHRVD